MELEWRPGGNAQFLQRIVESVQLMRKIHRLIVYSSSFYKKHEIPALKKKLHKFLHYAAVYRPSGNQTTFALLGNLVQSLTLYDRAQNTS